MIEYREARINDAKEVGLLHASNYCVNNQIEATEALRAEFVELWENRISQHSVDQFILLASNDIGFMGFVCVYGSKDSHWGSLIDNLHVSNKARRMGIASSLCIKAEEWLSLKYGDLPVYLLVLESNLAARKLYEKFKGRCVETLAMETHGGNIVNNCRYVWTQPNQLRQLPGS